MQKIIEVNGGSGNIELEEELVNVFQEYFQLWQAKQASYGTRNIGDFGERGWRQ